MITKLDYKGMGDWFGELGIELEKAGHRKVVTVYPPDYIHEFIAGVSPAMVVEKYKKRVPTDFNDSNEKSRDESVVRKEIADTLFKLDELLEESEDFMHDSELSNQQYYTKLMIEEFGLKRVKTWCEES